MNSPRPRPRPPHLQPPSPVAQGSRVNNRAPAGTGALLALLALCAPAAAQAQLRPLRPLEWDVFEPRTHLVLHLGGAALADQRASLAGTQGRLLELGDYAVSWRTGRVALGIAGTVLRRFRDDLRFAEPTGGAQLGDGVRTDAGDLTITTDIRLTPSWSNSLVVLRVGARLPVSDHVQGLERQQTDFLGLLAIGSARGRLVGGIESGIGIFGTRVREFAQQDDWIYAAHLGYRLGPVRPQLTFTGQTSPLRYRRIRGNEDLRELRLGLRAGNTHWLEAEWVHGLIPGSPSSGIRFAAGANLR